LKFEITGDNSNLLSSLDGARDGVHRAAQDIEQSGMGIEDMFKRIGAAAGIAFSLDAAKSFIGKVTEIRSFFQDIESSMEVFLGNQQKAAEFTQQLKDYAYYNMFEFKDLADASKQMIAYGHAVDDIIPRLDQLSNIATGTKADLMEMVALYNRAKSLGEVGSQSLASWATKGLVVKDVLKEMGVEVEGATVTFEQLNMVLDHVTEEGGMFHDLMLNQMSNISAEQGQLEDNLAAMYNEIGEKYQDFITGAIKAESWLVEHYKEVGSVIIGLIASYGEYQAALKVTQAIEKTMAKQANNIEQTRQQELQDLYGKYSDNSDIMAIGEETAAEEANTAAILQNTASREGNVTAIDEQIAALERKMLAEIDDYDAIIESAQAAMDAASEKEKAADKEIEVLQQQADTAREYLAQCNEDVEAANRSGDAQEIEAAKRNYNTAATEAENAEKALATAQSNKETAAEAQLTAQKNLETASSRKQATQEKLTNFQKAVGTTQTKAQTTATGLLVAMTKSATAAMNSLKVAMMSNPFGVAIAAITTIISLLPIFTEETSKADAEIERFGESAVKQVRNLDTLMAVIDNTSAESKVHKDAVDELAKIYEEYGFKIDEEIDKLQQLKDMHDLVTDAIHKEGEERQKANLLQSYNDALEEATTNMRDALQTAFEGAEYDGSGLFEDWDADEVQDRAKELTQIIGAIIQSEGDALATLTGDELEAKIAEVNGRIEKAYKDMGIESEKWFMKTNADGSDASGFFHIDVDAIEIMRDFADATHSVTMGRNALIKTFEEEKKAHPEVQKEVDYTTMSIADLAKEASKASGELSDLGDTNVSPTVDSGSIEGAGTAADDTKGKINLLNGMSAKPLIDTTSINIGIQQTNTLLGNMWKLGQMNGGNSPMNMGLGFNFMNQKPVFDMNGGKPVTSWMPNIPITDPAMLAQNELNSRFNSANSQKKVDDLLKQVNEALDKATFDSDEYNFLKGLKKRIEDKSRKKNKDKESLKEAEARQKYAEELRKQRLDRERAAKDLEFSTAQATIDAMDEGTNRQLAQARLDFEKRKEELKRGYEDLREQKIAQERALFEANPVNKDRVFTYSPNDARYTPTAEETALYIRQNENNRLDYYRELDRLTGGFATAQQERAEKTESLEKSVMGITEAVNAEKEKGIEADREAIRLLEDRLAVAKALLEVSRADTEELEYLMKYGDAATRINAIRQSYGGRISEATARGDSMEALSLEKEMEDAISQVNFEELKREVNWEALFGDLSSVTRKELQSLRQSLRDFIGAPEFADAGEEVRRSALEGINAVDAAIQQSGGVLSSIASARQARADALKRLVGAELAESGAEATLATLQEMQRQGTGNVTAAQVARASADLETARQNTTQARSGVSIAERNLKALTDGSIPKLAKEFETLRSAIAPVTDLFNSLGISGMGDVLGGIGDALGSATSVFQSFNDLKDMFGEDSAPGDLLGSAGPYAAAASAALSLGNTVYGMVLSSLDNHEEMVSIQNEATARLGLIDDHVQDIRKDMGESFGLTAIDKYNELADSINRSYSYYKTGVLAAGDDRYGGRHSEWWHRNKNGGKDLVSAIGSAYGIGFGDNSLQSFYTTLESMGLRGAEILNDIRTNYQDWWYQLVRDNSYDEGAIGKWVEQWADTVSELEDARAQLDAILSGTTEEDVFSDFMDNVYEFANGAEDAFDDVAASWQEMVNKMVINNVVGQDFKDKLKKWYEKFSKVYQDGGITTGEIDALRAEYDQYVQDAKDQLSFLQEQGLIQGTEEAQQQSGAGGVVKTMSQDAANELNGRFTAMQINNERISQQVMLAVQNLGNMTSLLSGAQGGVLTDIRQGIATGNGFLSDLYESIRRSNTEIIDRLGKIKENTERL